MPAVNNLLCPAPSEKRSDTPDQYALIVGRFHDAVLPDLARFSAASEKSKKRGGETEM